MITDAQPAQPSSGILMLGKPGCQIPWLGTFLWDANPSLHPGYIATAQAVLKTLQIFAGNVVWQ